MFEKLSEKSWNRLSWILIVITIIVLIRINFLMGSPWVIGEWDDISLVTVSVLNDGNVTIDADDIVQAKQWIPEWEERMDYIHLSGYHTKSGDSLSWYFPLFSVMCAPLMAILRVLGISGVYTFSLMNILLYLFAVVYAYKASNFSARVKLGFMLSLCINPIIIYTKWPSGEVFIFSFLLVSLICWGKEKYRQAALYLSIASTLNPSVLMVGIVMIIEYLYRNIRDVGIWHIWKRSKDILLLAVCYVPCLLPFAWNLYYVGHINMTAATEMDMDIGNVVGRFLSYLFDLNLGFLPYYGIMMILFLVAIISSAYKRYYKVLLMAVSFVGVCLIYSMEIHINSGMSGLARYNAWSAVIILVAFFMWRNECTGQKQIKVLDIGILGSIAWTALAMLSIMLTNPREHKEMTPIAKVVLEYAPHLYNPLPDVFNVRVNHVDEIGYEHNLPIVYRDGNWQCRKILANYDNKEYILQHIASSEENILWISEQLDALEDQGDKYISIGKDKIFYWEDWQE